MYLGYINTIEFLNTFYIIIALNKQFLLCRNIDMKTKECECSRTEETVYKHSEHVRAARRPQLKGDYEPSGQ